VARQTVLVCLGVFLVFTDSFRVEVLDNEEVYGNASFVSVTGPLGVL
jgi:hypothetical protein